MRVLAGISNLLLLLFMLRRWLFLLAALLPERIKSDTAKSISWPEVLILVPFRNERLTLPALLGCLEQMDYPVERMTTVLIDDGSSDGGDQIASEWLARRPGVQLLRLGENVGKAAALNVALARYAQGELVAVYDADERPEPLALSRLAAAFEEPDLAAASGQRSVSNPLDSLLTSHAALESLVHQQVTSRAKERLGLSPPILGSNCVYRRSVLERVGCFQPGALLEDSDLTLRFVRSGWRTTFVPEAISAHAAPRTLAGYWRQHTRWTKGFGAVARNQAGPTLRASQLPWLLRLELLVFSLGYLDRAAWLFGCLWLAGRMWQGGPRPWCGLGLLVASWLTPLVQVIAALKQARAPRPLWWRTLWLPLLLPIDMFMAVWGFMRGGRNWEESEAYAGT